MGSISRISRRIFKNMLIWMSQGEDGLNSSRGRIQEPQSEGTDLANDSGVRFRKFL